MSSDAAPSFAAIVETTFAPGALGEFADSGAAHVAVRLEERLLSTGRRLLTASPTDIEPVRNVVLAASGRGFSGMYTELCLRLAQRHHWAVAAPEPFGRFAHLAEAERLRSIDQLDDDETIGDLELAADHLAPEPVALIGFCIGGMYAYKAAARLRFDRVVAFYGIIRLPPHWRGPGQSEPLSALGADHAPLLALVGGRDAFTPADDVAALEAAGATTMSFAEAGHAFAADPTLPSYRAADAAAAWRAAVEHVAPAT